MVVRTARLHAAGRLRLHDEPEPTPPRGHELVAVGAVGICGSDLHWFSEGAIGDAGLDRPLVIGHEFAGTIRGGRRDGTLVAVDPAIPCHRCTCCRRGDDNLCDDMVFAGHGATDGALRELLTWPGALLHPMPDGMTAVEGALLEPLGVALHALDLSHQRVGDTVAVVGCGPIGLLLVQAARVAGADRVVGVEPLAHRRRAARAAGADAVVDPATASAEWDAVADVVHEVSGAPDSLDLCATLARPGARVLLTGIPDGDEMAFRASVARRRGLTMVHVRRMRANYPRAIALVADGRIDLSGLADQVFDLADVEEAFTAAAARTGTKVVVTP